MAKAKFHKSQRVFEKPVGTWAYIEGPAEMDPRLRRAHQDHL